MAKKPEKAKKLLCPSDFLDDTADLSPAAFRAVVGRRARRLGLSREQAATETQRRSMESEISDHFEKIHKGRDFLPAAFLRAGARRAKAVCRIVTPTSLGTGFLIAPGILMTNNHVLRSETTAGRSIAQFGFEVDADHVEVSLRPERLFITLRQLDFTIVACDTTGIEDILHIPLRRDPASVTRHERVNIIQHPRGRPKEVALHENKVIRVRDLVVHYRTDTEPGSSGSPVFNNAWDLVALHHAGEQRGSGARNEGIRISAIVEFLIGRRRESASTEAFEALLGTIEDPAPALGFFDLAGLRRSEGFEVEVRDFTGTGTFADVGVWNIEHFNRRVSDRRVRDVGEVVSRLSLDVFGLTEVEEGALERLVAELAGQGTLLGFEALDLQGSQDIAVLFDTETTTVDLRQDLNRRYRDLLSRRTRSGRTAFPRDPLFAQCTVQDAEGNSVSFLFLVVHLKAFGDAQSRERRRLAARTLREIIDDLRDREELPVVLGGDFNERLDNDVLAALKDSPDLLSLTADDATEGALSFVGRRHRSLIDHFIVSKDVKMGDISGDDAAIVRLDQSVRDFSDRVSDHVPIVFRMILRDEPTDVVPGDGQDDGQDEPADADTLISVPDGAEAVRVTFEGGQEGGG